MNTKRFLSVLLAALMLAATLLSGVILPAAEENAPEDATPTTYVTDGLVSLYKGEGNSPDATVWEDSVGDNHLPITKDDKNYFTETGLAAEGAQHYFPQAIVEQSAGWHGIHCAGLSHRDCRGGVALRFPGGSARGRRHLAEAGWSVSGKSPEIRRCGCRPAGLPPAGAGQCRG